VPEKHPLCAPCIARLWTQIPAQNKACPHCGMTFCPRHMIEHQNAMHLASGTKKP
jgi:hypothetical protein